MGLLTVAERRREARAPASEVKAEYRSAFIEEAREHLEEWEAALLELERRPGDAQLVNRIFRAIHTLKGSSGFIGLTELQQLDHDLETALHRVRDGEAAIDGETIDLLFDGHDLSRRMVEDFAAGEPWEKDAGGRLAEVRARAARLTGGEERPAGRAAVPRAPTPSAADCSAKRRFVLALAVTAGGREAFLRAMLVRNRLGGVATILAEEPAPELIKDSAEGFRYRVTVATDSGEEALRKALYVDQVEVEGISEIAGARESALQGAASPQRSETSRTPAGSEDVVRVAVERLDNLLNLVGELVIHNSSFAHLAEHLQDRYGRDPSVLELRGKTEGLVKIARSLQDGIMKVRMLPVASVFNRFHRIVRDLAKSGAKEISLAVFGEETEIDKKVMDRISDPLLHLVRNAVDHGIELPAERTAAGKPRFGLVRLGAYQEGDHICIEVGDDGRGLRREAIVQKAVARGLLASDRADGLSDEEAFAFIFLPGFSTAERVTEISGRGVGMDVVKRAVEALGGSVRLRSAPGRGTTVTLSLPLTMAIIPALLVAVEELALAIPLSTVREVLRLRPATLETVGGRLVVRLRNQVVPLLPLAEALELPGRPWAATPERVAMVVIVDFDGTSVGLAVDQVRGTREIVIKSLSRHYRQVEGLIGASILGNGQIALIVDVQELLRRYRIADRPGRPESRAASEHMLEPASPPQAPAGESPFDGGEPELRGGSLEEQLPCEELLGSGRCELFAEINNAGALQASQALSAMTASEIRVSFPESLFVPVAQVPELLGGEELPVGGIYVGLSGELHGGILTLLPEEYLMRFHNLLHGLPAEARCERPADPSGIEEMANVLSASFADAFADAAHLLVRTAPPELSIDMCGPILEGVLARFNEPGERILLTKALLYLGEVEQVACYLVMFLEPASLHRLFETAAKNETPGVAAQDG